MRPKPDWIWKLSPECFLKRIEDLPEKAWWKLVWIRFIHDPGLFAWVVLPAHCRHRFAAMHRQIFAWQVAMGDEPLPDRRGLRFALAAPRGSGKSTVISLHMLLHDILCQREQYIVLLSATERQARQRLKAVANELFSANPVLYKREQRPGERRVSGGTILWDGVRVDAYGAGSEIRGISHGEWRPTKIILDDAEASRSADSALAREKIATWFAEVVEYLGAGYTHMVAVGTILHRRGLLATLLARPDFTGRLYKSIETFSPRQDRWSEWRRILLDHSLTDRRSKARDYFLRHRAEMEAGTVVLWREKEDYEELMCQLTLQGRRAFYQEKQNEPLSPEEAMFDRQRMVTGRRDGKGGLSLFMMDFAKDCGSEVVIRRYPPEALAGRRYGYLDGAMGKGGAGGRGDFAALAVVLQLPDGTWLLDHVWTRRAAPTEQAKHVIRYHGLNPLEVLAVEATGFQELLMDTLRAEEARQEVGATPMSLVAWHPKRAKGARIAQLEPMLSAGKLVLGEDLSEEFMAELESWPKCRHDDALDAVAGALEVAMSRVGNDKSDGVYTGKSPKSRAGW